MHSSNASLRRFASRAAAILVGVVATKDARADDPHAGHEAMAGSGHRSPSEFAQLRTASMMHAAM